MRTLPKWDDSMSDGCSVPKSLRWLFPVERERIRARCVRHDRAYYLGGTETDRLVADKQFLYGLICDGMSSSSAHLYYLAVRVGGAPIWRVKGQSWAFGGEYFRYGERAVEMD